MSVRTAIEDFLAIVSCREGDEAHRIQKLVASLDELALWSNNVHYVFDDRDYPEPPEREL